MDPAQTYRRLVPVDRLAAPVTPSDDVYASIDTRACVEPKQSHDVVGYYNRFESSISPWTARAGVRCRSVPRSPRRPQAKKT